MSMWFKHCGEPLRPHHSFALEDGGEAIQCQAELLAYKISHHVLLLTFSI